LDWARSYVAYPDAVRRFTPIECERLQGLPENWTLPDLEDAVPIRGIETNRYRAIGNAVCVPVAEWVARRIQQNYEAGLTPTSSADAKPTKHDLTQLANKFVAPVVSIKELTGQDECSDWKTGGLAFQDHYFTAPVSSSPLAPSPSTLIDVVDREGISPRYFLSANAAQGILRRVEKMERRLFSPLDAALRRLAKTPDALPVHSSPSSAVRGATALR
jgi:DNA (cytosine-5)-methyltransferase 1